MTAARIAKGLTQSELADRAGIHLSMVTWAEIQSRDLCLSTAIKIAKVLEVGLDELCGLKMPEEFEEKRPGQQESEETPAESVASREQQ